MTNNKFKARLALWGLVATLSFGMINFAGATSNVAITQGSGTSIATDEVSSVQHQLVKLEYGTAGAATLVSTTNPLPALLYNVEKAEDSAHTTADKMLPIVAVREASATDLSAGGTDGDYEPLQVDATGSLRVVLAAGTAAIGKLAANSGVDIGDVDITSIIPGTGATNSGKAEDAAHTTGDTGAMLLGVRKAAVTDLSAGATDGDYEPLTIDALSGAVRTAPTASTVGGWLVYRNLDIDETTGTTTQQLKSAPGKLHTCTITNNTASTIEFVKFYDATSLTGSAAGTETPVLTYPIPGATSMQLVLDYDFLVGMTVAATTAIADADTGAPATNAIILNCTYK